MRSAEKDQLAQAVRPGMACGPAVMACTAREQTAHAVAENDQLIHWYRPCPDQPFETVGKLPAVGGYVPTAIVMQVQRGIAKGASQLVSVVVVTALPHQIIHAQAMGHHQ